MLGLELTLKLDLTALDAAAARELRLGRGVQEAPGASSGELADAPMLVPLDESAVDMLVEEHIG